MKYTMTTPCSECPFLNTPRMKRAFPLKRLKEFASGQFPCHKTARLAEADGEQESGYVAKENSVHCAGALIFLEKRGQANQMMRICERLGMYDRSKLDMNAEVR